jgi:CRP/FNR family cyclic AMP-dependent transcriptional regulator
MRALDNRGPLDGLSPQAERELLALGRPRYFAPGDLLPSTLFSPGAPYAVLILEGLVKLTAISAGERETLLWVRGPGDLLGEHGALHELGDDQHRRARGTGDLFMTGTAMTAVKGRGFPSGDLRQFLQSHPAALAAVALRLWERLEEAESRIASTGRDNADRRLARLLCDLESYGNPQAPGHGVLAGTEIPVKLSQEEFASWIGASRETVERALRGWRQRGIVSTRYRTIVVHDLESLARIAGIEVRRRTWNWPEPAIPQGPGTSPRRPRSAKRGLGEGLGALIPAATPHVG